MKDVFAAIGTACTLAVIIYFLFGLILLIKEQITKWQFNKQQEPKWIPVSERLPKGTEIVLLTLLDDDNNRLIICGHYIGGRNCEWGISDGARFGYGLVSAHYGPNPIAWMPLPEPYKESDEE